MNFFHKESKSKKKIFFLGGGGGGGAGGGGVVDRWTVEQAQTNSCFNFFEVGSITMH